MRKPTVPSKLMGKNKVMILLLCPDEFKAKDHSVQVINEVVGKINLTHKTNKYESRGTFCYHQQNLLIMLVYYSVKNAYSCRIIIEVCKNTSIIFGWRE